VGAIRDQPILNHSEDWNIASVYDRHGGDASNKAAIAFWRRRLAAENVENPSTTSTKVRGRPQHGVMGLVANPVDSSTRRFSCAASFNHERTIGCVPP
jgi:hypothetical protein